MKIIIVEPKKAPRIAEIEYTLEAMQKVVDGYIEAIHPFNDNIAVVCNEEGFFKDLPVNRIIKNSNGKVCNFLLGTFFAVGTAEEDFISLTDEQLKKYTEIFNHRYFTVERGFYK